VLATHHVALCMGRASYVLGLAPGGGGVRVAVAVTEDNRQALLAELLELDDESDDGNGDGRPTKKRLLPSTTSPTRVAAPPSRHRSLPHPPRTTPQNRLVRRRRRHASLSRPRRARAAPSRTASTSPTFATAAGCGSASPPSRSLAPCRASTCTARGGSRSGPAPRRRRRRRR
jgi:hypothetical protein